MDVEEGTDWTIASTRLFEMRRLESPVDDECVISRDDLCGDQEPQVILLRHGESSWNDLNRFTGWHDVPLSELGEQQAVEAARLLLEEGICFDHVYCSKLKRTIKTSWLLLEELDAFDIPITQAWQLNERMYGALTGLNKKATRLQLGELHYEQLRREPPPMEDDSCYDPSRGSVGRGVPPELMPRKESFEDTTRRVMPYWNDEILPRLHETGKSVLIISSKNLLRSLIVGITDLPIDQAVELDIPNGMPIAFNPKDGTLRAVGPLADSWPRKAEST